VRISGSKSADKLVVEYSVSDNQGDEMEEYAQALVDDFDFIALDEYDFGGKRGSNFQFVKVSDEDDEYIVIVTLDFNNNGYTLTIERREGELSISIGPDDADFAPDGDTHDGEEPAISDPDGWPTDHLPPDFPVYPNGEFEYFLHDKGVVVIAVDNTDKNAYEGYIDDLKAWGFKFEEPDPVVYPDGYDDGYYIFETESWMLILSAAPDFNRVSITLGPINDTDTGDGPATEYTKGWPTDELPAGFPVYPGGEPEYTIIGSHVLVFVANTDRNAFEGYMDTLIAWGFEFGAPDSKGEYIGYKENWEFTIIFLEDINFLSFGLGPVG